MFAGLWIFALCIIAPSCFAHATSETFLYLHAADAEISGRWDIHLRDLELAMELDADADGRITWGELTSQSKAVLGRLEKTLLFSTVHGECGLDLNGLQVAERTDGLYASALLSADCGQNVESLSVEYNFLFDLDAQHKALVMVSGALGEHSAVLSAHSATAQFAVASQSLWSVLRDYFILGVWHIWTGLDHLLFLLVLLLPAARYVGPNDGSASARKLLWQVLKIVTAFSVAHSITLSLAAVDVLVLPSRWVESAIAFSVIVAAANSLVLRLDKHLPLLAFGFGLIHGLGFAGVLGELGLPVSMRVGALAAFNIGVEFGQLVIVTAVLPLILIWRKNDFYMRRAMPAAAFGIGALGFLWFIERIIAV